MTASDVEFTPDELHALNRVVELLRKSRNLLFITGAGMSADSGLPTYRGVGGLYNGIDTDEGMPIEELMSGRVFRQRPELTWKYLRRREEICRGSTFNRGHQVIAEMDAHFDRVWTLTQNVDGFHRLAGSRNVIEIHGNLHNLRCTHCDYRKTVEDYCDLAEVPRCPLCQGIVRPDVILFGESLPEEPVRQLYTELRKGFDLIFTIGTTSVFPYIAEPVLRARDRGTPTVEINPTETEVSHLVDIKLSMGAARALDAVWAKSRP